MKNKSLKGKLILSVATLGLAAASTIGSTFAWFTINSSATATGVDMTATSGELVMIRKTTSHNEAFSDSATINTTKDGAKWLPVAPIADVNNAATAVTDTVKWGTLDLKNTLANNTYTYTEVSPSNKTSNNEAYTISTTKEYTGGTATDYIAYAHFVIDYVVTKGKSPVLKLTGIDSTAITNNYFRKSVRIAIAQGSTVNPGTTDETWTVSYGAYTTYALEDASSEDLQLKALQELGLKSTVASQNQTATTYDATNGITLTAPGTSKSGADNLGSISVYVWIDGNAKDCTNSAQSGTAANIGFTFTTK